MYLVAVQEEKEKKKYFVIFHFTSIFYINIKKRNSFFSWACRPASLGLKPQREEQFTD